MQKLIICILVLGLSACAAFVPREHLISKERIASTLQERFPLRMEKLGGFLGATIDVPRLGLVPEQNRVIIEGDFVTNAGNVQLSGHFVFSSTLRYDPEQFALFLKETRLESLQFKRGHSFPEIARSHIDRLLAESLMTHPVYRFRPSQLVVLGAEIEVETIEVLQDGVLLKFQKISQKMKS